MNTYAHKKIPFSLQSWRFDFRCIESECMVLLIVQCIQHEGSETLDRALCTSEALRWQCFATASGMYCTILRFRGAVSFNQVPYPAGTVSSSSSCRRRPPWSRLLLALAPGSSQTSPHNLGAPPLEEGESIDDEWQPCGREHPGQAPQHSTRVNSIWTPLSGRTLAWLKLNSPVPLLRVFISSET